MSTTIKQVYVSITGLRLQAWYHAPTFWYHAIPSVMQAKASEGIISVTTKTIEGVHHTMTVWDSRKHMLQYLRSGDHAKAMRAFDDFATGSTYGYETTSDQIPTWEEARIIWEEKGQPRGKAARDAKRIRQEGHPQA